MDVLCAGNVEGFVLVSSDSDFTRLATRPRESGMTVYGLGRRNTPEPFVGRMDRFIYLDLLATGATAYAAGRAARAASCAPWSGSSPVAQQRLEGATAPSLAAVGPYHREP